MEPKWQRKVDALIRLAEDQRGKPEGRLAEKKLARILRRHPEAVQGPPRRQSPTPNATGNWSRADALQNEMNQAMAKFYDELVGSIFGVPKDT